MNAIIVVGIIVAMVVMIMMAMVTMVMMAVVNVVGIRLLPPMIRDRRRHDWQRRL